MKAVLGRNPRKAHDAVRVAAAPRGPLAALRGAPWFTAGPGGSGREARPTGPAMTPAAASRRHHYFFTLSRLG